VIADPIYLDQNELAVLTLLEKDWITSNGQPKQLRICKVAWTDLPEKIEQLSIDNLNSFRPLEWLGPICPKNWVTFDR